MRSRDGAPEVAPSGLPLRSARSISHSRRHCETPYSAGRSRPGLRQGRDVSPCDEQILPAIVIEIEPADAVVRHPLAKSPHPTGRRYFAELALAAVFAEWGKFDY